MRSAFPSLCVGSILMCVPVLLHAQEATHTITGQILEAGLDDYGVADVTITAEGSSLQTKTDASGEFVLANVPASLERVVLVLESKDYTTRRVSIDPRAQEPLRLELEWEGEQAEVQTVAMTWREVETASSNLLTSRDIEAAPHRNAEEVLRQVPGLTLVQHGSEGKGYQYFMRGFDAIHGADLELKVDGILLNEWSNIHAQGYLDLSLIIPEMIDTVQVTKGPFSLEQGAFAMAGSANYRLGVNEDARGWRVAYTAGSTRRHRVFAGYSPGEGTGDEFVGMEATHDEGFGQRRGLSRATMNAKKRLLGRPQSPHHLDMLTLASASRFELPGPLRQEDVARGAYDFYDTYDLGGRGEAERALLALTSRVQRDRMNLATTFHLGYRRLDLIENFTGFLIDPVHGDRRHQRQHTWSCGLRSELDHQLAERLNLRLGFGVQGDRFVQQEDNVGQAFEVRDVRRDLEGTQLITHALTGLQWRPHERVSVDAGGRLDVVHVNIRDALDAQRSNQGTIPALSPRVSSQWQFHDTLQLFATYGHGFRPPEARAFSSFEATRTGLSEELYTGGEPTNTTSRSTELGSRWAPSRHVDARLAGFATFIERESIFDHVSGTSLELNGTRRLGAELSVAVHPRSWLTLGADATYADARFITSGNRVPLAPWLVSGVRATATHPSGWRSGLRMLAVAPRPLPHGATGATLTRLDATLGYHWRALRLGLAVENMLNQQIREGEYHYASHWEQGAPASQIPVLHVTAGPPLNARLTLEINL